MAIDNETVEYDIRIEAVLALKTLADLTNSVRGFKNQIQEATTFIRSQAQQWGVPFQQVKSELQALDASLSKNAASSTVFGGAGQAAWNQVGQASQQAEQKVRKSSQGIVGHFTAMRIAAGILVSMLVHNVLQAFQQVFTTAISNIRETELAIYNLINAERRLSEEGIDVTPKGLQETIDSVRELVPVLSKIQAEELVSRIATNVAPSLKLTNEQIRQMSESVALLFVRNKALGKSFEEVESQLTNAFLTGRVSQGINNLGVKLSDQIVRDEALRLGLVKTEQEFDNLTGEMEAQVKAAAMLSVVYQNAQQDLTSLGDYMETTDAAVEKTKTVWSDFLTEAGTAFGPVLRVGLKVITNALEIMLIVLQKVRPVLIDVASTIVGFVEASRNLPQYWQMWGQGYADFFENFAKFKSQAEKSFTSLSDHADTATASIENLVDASESFDADGFGNEIEDIIENTQNALEDLDTDLDRKRTDIDTEYQRKSADAWLDYQRKLEDINQDSADKITEIKQKFREDDREREAKYQNELWELQQKYLLDLEDALHERDARQIIRLQKQYAIDKESMERKKNLDTNQSQRDMEIDIQQAQNEAKNKREQARLEYERDLQDQQIAKQRELEDLRIWHQRELQDIQTTQQRKLETLIRGWIEEGKITQAGAAQVYSILRGYFGPGGLTDQLYQYMMNSMMSTTSRLPASMSGAPAPYFDLAAASANSLNSGNIGRTVTSPSRRVGMAEGGTYLARTPQSIDVAEKGPELIQATPIGRLGADINKMFLQSSGKEGLAGAMEIGVTLSPDLEARVINKSLDSVGDIILKVNRTKV